eukprot:g9619.t1
MLHDSISATTGALTGAGGVQFLESESLFLPLTLRASDSGAIIVFFSEQISSITLLNIDYGKIGVTFTFVIGSSESNLHKVHCSDEDDDGDGHQIIGSLLSTDTDSFNSLQAMTAKASDNFSGIEHNGGSTGGAGSEYTLTCIADRTWLVSGTIIHITNNASTPFKNLN